MIYVGISAARQIFILSFLCLASAVSCAMPSTTEVAKAVREKDWQKAEALLKDVLREKNSAKAHYQLGQVYASEYRHGEALAEYRTAQDLDPSLSFASSKSLFVKLFEIERSIVEGSEPTHRSSDDHPAVAPLTINSETPQAAGAENSFAVPVAKEPVHSGHAVAWFASGLAVFLCALALFVSMKRRDSKKVVVEQIFPLADKANNQYEEIKLFTSQLFDAELECKKASYETSKKDVILEKIGDVRADVLAAITTLKSGKQIYESHLKFLKSRMAAVSFAVKYGEWPASQVVENDTPGENPFAFNPRQAQKPSAVPSSSNLSTTQLVGPQTAPETIRVQNDSGPGFFSGMMLGSMMNSGSHSNSAPIRESDDNKVNSSRNSFDFGGDAGFGGTSVSESSDFDAGNGDDY